MGDFRIPERLDLAAMLAKALAVPEVPLRPHKYAVKLGRLQPTGEIKMHQTHLKEVDRVGKVRILSFWTTVSNHNLSLIPKLLLT